MRWLYATDFIAARADVTWAAGLFVNDSEENKRFPASDGGLPGARRQSRGCGPLTMDQMLKPSIFVKQV
jgi:hypothetical protein